MLDEGKSLGLIPANQKAGPSVKGILKAMLFITRNCGKEMSFQLAQQKYTSSQQQC